jgi:hypothetical protein
MLQMAADVTLLLFSKRNSLGIHFGVGATPFDQPVIPSTPLLTKEKLMLFPNLPSSYNKTPV